MNIWWSLTKEESGQRQEAETLPYNTSPCSFCVCFSCCSFERLSVSIQLQPCVSGMVLLLFLLNICVRWMFSKQERREWKESGASQSISPHNVAKRNANYYTIGTVWADDCVSLLKIHDLHKDRNNTFLVWSHQLYVVNMRWCMVFFMLRYAIVIVYCVMHAWSFLPYRTTERSE